MKKGHITWVADTSIMSKDGCSNEAIELHIENCKKYAAKRIPEFIFSVEVDKAAKIPRIVIHPDDNKILPSGDKLSHELELALIKYRF